MKKNNLKIVKIDRKKNLFNYEKKVLIKDLILDLKLGYFDFEKEILSSDNKVALIGIVGSLCAVTLILILIISEKINSKIKGL